MADSSLIFIVFFLCTIACHAFECPEECDTSQTCCPSVAGDYLCCPHPNAVCCADGENCCPENTLCDSSSGGCVPQHTTSQEFHDRKGPQDLMDTLSQEFHERKGPQDLMDHTESTVEPEETSSVIVCPDWTDWCPENNTCCVLPDLSYGCCPYVNAVCCFDFKHCCPHGEICDLTTMTCFGKQKNLSAMKRPALPLV